MKGVAVSRYTRGMANPVLRAATEADVPAIYGMIVELAVFEREPDAVAITEEQLREDGWGAHRAFECFVAEDPAAGVCGFALFHAVYSTWAGRSLYLEDLYVKPSHRGRGVGTALLRRVAQEAVKRGCARLDWSVLTWNEQALRMYDHIGAGRMEEWRRMRLSEHALAAFAVQPLSAEPVPGAHAAGNR